MKREQTLTILFMLFLIHLLIFIILKYSISVSAPKIQYQLSSCQYAFSQHESHNNVQVFHFSMYCVMCHAL